MLVFAIQQHKSHKSAISNQSPPSWTFLEPWTPSHPLRCPRALGLSTLHHTGNSHWVSILHMIMYVSVLPFQFVPPSPSTTVSTSLFSIIWHAYGLELTFCPSCQLDYKSMRSEFFFLVYLFMTVSQGSRTVSDTVNIHWKKISCFHFLLTWTPSLATQVIYVTQGQVLSSPSSFCPLQDRSMNRRQGVEARIMTLFWKPADQEDGRLMSQNNHHIRVWMPGFFYNKVGEGEEVKWKRLLILQISLGMVSLRRGCVNFFLPLTIHRWTGSWTKAFWFNIQAEG